MEICASSMDILQPTLMTLHLPHMPLAEKAKRYD